MKNRKVLKLFAVMLAASLAATSAPQTAFTVFAATEEAAGSGQDAPTEKHQTSVDDFVIDNSTVSYNFDPYWPYVDVKDPLDWNKVTLSYKDADGNSLEGQPVNAGVYHVYVSYEEDEYCTGLEATDTGKTVTIEKSKDGLFYPIVVNKDDRESVHEYECGYAVDAWQEEFEGTVSATVTVAGEDAEYIDSESLQYDAESKSVKFRITDKASGLTENKTVLVHVDFGESFHNFDVEFDIPVVITVKQPVGCDINWDETGDLTYDGEAKTLKYNISYWEDGVEDITGKLAAEISNFKVTITKDGKEISEIKDAGDYIVSAVYDDGKYYGEMKVGVGVRPQEIASLEGRMSFTAPTGLIYNGENQADAIRKGISVTDPAMPEGSYLICFIDEDGNESEGVWNAGTYKVIVYSSYENGAPNYVWENSLVLGEVTVAKRQPQKSDFEIGYPYSMYDYGNGIDAEVEPAEGLDWDRMTVTYKNEDDTEIVKPDGEGRPTQAGTYKVYVSYEGDDNVEGMDSTCIGEMEVWKYNVRPTLNPCVVNAEDTGEQEYDISWFVEEWKENDDKSVSDFSAKVTTYSSSDEQYFKSLEYKDGKICFTFDTEKTKDLENNTWIDLDVDFGDAFPNNEGRISLTVIVTDKIPATCELVRPEDDFQFVYDGTAKDKELVYKITYWDEESGQDKEITGTAAELKNYFNVEFVKDEGDPKEIKDAGTYYVHATYDDGKYYGKLEDQIYVAPKKIESLDDLVSLSQLQDLTYNGKDQAETIKNQITMASDIGIYDLEIKFRGENGDQEELCDVGTYEVIAYSRGGNYEWDDCIKLGEVTIVKGEAKLTVTADANGTPTIKLGDQTISNDDSRVKIEYYQGDTKLDAKPTAAGNYKVKVTYTDAQNLSAPLTAEASFTISGSGSGDSGSGSGSGTTTPTTPTTPGTSTETKPDGSTVETVTEKETNTAGKDVEVTTTTTKDAAGNVTGVTEQKVIAEADKNTSATITTQTDASGKKEVTAEIVKTGAASNGGTKGTVSSAVVSQITEAAGTKDILITQTVVKEDGKTAYTVKVNASDLVPGSKLKIFKYNTKTGEYTLCNNKDYKVSSQGGLALTIKGSSTYCFLNQDDADQTVKEILDTVKVTSASKTVSKGKTAKISLSKKLNMANVSKVTYSSTKTSVAKVDKKGKITAKKAGTVTIKAKVTLKNGKTKTVTMKVKVK